MGRNQKDEFKKHWLNAAKYEHASIASFAQVILELTSFGAPVELISGATRAMDDEIRHAKIAFSLAQKASDNNKKYNITKLDLKPQLRNFDDFIKDNYRDAIINEAESAKELFKYANNQERQRRYGIAKLIKEVASDETRHANLGEQIDTWANKL